MRAAYLDMTDDSQDCPGSLLEHTVSNVRTCTVQQDAGGCSSAFYSTSYMPYSKVCGRVIAYHGHSLDGFHGRFDEPIDSNYVDGVSLTYGSSPRQHIWSFAARYRDCNCGSVHSYVGNDYFCEVAPNGDIGNHLNNPIWNANGCTNNNSPFFYKQLSEPSTDSIEMRVCRDQIRADEDLLLQGLEIYIQ